MGVDLKKKVNETEEALLKLKNGIVNLQTVLVAFKTDSVKNSTGSQNKESNFERRIGFLEVTKEDSDGQINKLKNQTEIHDKNLMDLRVLAPIGSIVYFTSSSSSITDITNGESTWVKCDGREISKTTYSSVYSAVGNTYGYGSTADNFKIPDMTNKIMVEGIFLIIRIK